MNTNFKLIGLTRLGINPKSRAPEANALTTRPSELLQHLRSFHTVHQRCSPRGCSWPRERPRGQVWGMKINFDLLSKNWGITTYFGIFS